jgi:anti-sigma factor RsiW
MSNEEQDRLLHRYHDGDLSPEERAAVEAELASSDTLRSKLDGLREVSVVVRAAAQDGAGEIDAGALWAKIDAQLAADRAEAAPAVTATNEAPAESATARPALKLVPGGATTAQPTPVVEDPQSRRRRQIGVFVGALAIAAAVMLALFGPGDDDGADVVADGTTDPGAPTPPESARPEWDGEPDHTEVLAVDFGTNVGTIFSVEGDEGQRFAVVWLDDVNKDAEAEGALPREDVAPIEAPTPD